MRVHDAKGTAVIDINHVAVREGQRYVGCCRKIHQLKIVCRGMHLGSVMAPLCAMRNGRDDMLRSYILGNDVNDHTCKGTTLYTWVYDYTSSRQTTVKVMLMV